MKEVLLLGHLGEKYGSNWKIVANSYQDIFQCINANYPGFTQDLVDLHLSGGDLEVTVRGNIQLEVEALFYPLDADTIIIAPVASGSKSGTAKVIIGTLLLIASFATPGAAPILGASFAGWLGTAVAAVGVNLAIVGLQQMLSPDPSVDNKDKDYLFGGPENTVVGSNPVPILCGELIIGGILISSGVVGSGLSGDATFNGYNPRDATKPFINNDYPMSFDVYTSAVGDLFFQQVTVDLKGIVGVRGDVA